MVTATQSADKSELGARLEKRVDHRLSGVLDTEKRSSTACPIARLVATAQVHQGGALLIDRDPAADNGLAFLRDIEPGSSDPRIVLAGRNSGQLTSEELRA